MGAKIIKGKKMGRRIKTCQAEEKEKKRKIPSDRNMKEKKKKQREQGSDSLRSLLLLLLNTSPSPLTLILPLSRSLPRFGEGGQRAAMMRQTNALPFTPPSSEFRCEYDVQPQSAPCCLTCSLLRFPLYSFLPLSYLLPLSSQRAQSLVMASGGRRRIAESGPCFIPAKTLTDVGRSQQ